MNTLANNINLLKNEFAVYPGMKMTPQNAHDLYNLAKRQAGAIKQLVELVAEMRDELCMAGNVINSENVNAEWLKPIITKADVFLNKLGEV